MKSRYGEAFNSLQSDDNKKRERTERILREQEKRSAKAERRESADGPSKPRRRFAGKRGVALITAAAVLLAAIAIAVPVWIGVQKNGGLLNAVSRLKGTFVNLNGVAAFGVWNAPHSVSDSARITNVSYIRKDAPSAPGSEVSGGEDKTDVITGEWSGEDRYDWESDFDWDPTKSNVLISIGEDGKISEVVYERTNGRGQVRQDSLGNAAAVYVSESFTYVMYVDDQEWAFWQEINFAQEMLSSGGFHCHHEKIQTVVIHNATGKVFPLKDLIPQVNALSGKTNYTMQVEPLKDDTLCVVPLYGRYIPLWYNVVYDEQQEKIRYELVLPVDSEAVKSYDTLYNVRAVRRDKYGQQYVLEGDAFADNDSDELRAGAGIVELPPYTRYGDAIVFSVSNGMMFGTDNRMYAFDGNRLKVFGENFQLNPVEAGTSVSFEGMANEPQNRIISAYNSIAYRLEGGYLYSMFGEVWKVDGDGVMTACESLKGIFPRCADEGYLIGGEIIALAEAQYVDNGRVPVNGKLVHIRFGSEGGTPKAVIKHILDVSEMRVIRGRMVVEQNERPFTNERGYTKYFLLTVEDGAPRAEYFAYGYDGGVGGLVKPITQPLMLS